MELPKNITQIGETNGDSRIYVEDYVISYLKQLNLTAVDKGVAAALYGRRQEENGLVYFFLYGACRLTGLNREVRHLSQAQRQEIENLRRKYFPEQTFLGYCLLNGEMLEGFHICEQEICRYLSGYAQFYEKNDGMLAYMLAVRDEAEPEQVNQEKYEEVKRRQEERRAASRQVKVRKPVVRQHRQQEHPKGQAFRMPEIGKLQGMRIAVISVFVLLCLIGVIGVRDLAKKEGIDDIQASAKKWWEGMRGQLPEEEVVAANSSVQKDTLVMEDKLEQVLLEENRQAQLNFQGGDDEGALGAEGASEVDDFSDSTPDIDSTIEKDGVPEGDGVPETDNAPEIDDAPEEAVSEQNQDVSEEISVVAANQTPSAVAYVIKRGDTLIGISKRQYGSDARVADICSLNNISDPNNIKEGQIIMLPQ